MKKTALFMILTLIGGAGLAFANQSIPLRDFFRNLEKAAFRLSPSGTYLAWLPTC